VAQADSFLPMPAGLITDWTIEEVQNWLGSVALGSLKTAFKERGIDGTRMLALGVDERLEVGFTPRKAALFEKKLDEQKFKIMLRDREIKKKLIAAASKPPPKPKTKQIPSKSAYSPYSPPGSERGSDYADPRDVRGRRVEKGLPSISRDTGGWNSSVVTSQQKFVPRDNEPWKTKEELRQRRARQVQEEEALLAHLASKQLRQSGQEQFPRGSHGSRAHSGRNDSVFNSDAQGSHSRFDQYENDFERESHHSQSFDDESDHSERMFSQDRPHFHQIERNLILQDAWKNHHSPMGVF
jgi:hypothetical protein